MARYGEEQALVKKFLILLAIGLLGIAPSAQAAGAVSGKIQQIRIDADGRAMVFFDQPIGSSSPACVNGPAYGKALAFNSATAAGKSVLSVLLLAKSTGRTVHAYGLGTCTVYGNGTAEDWNYGTVD